MPTKPHRRKPRQQLDQSQVDAVIRLADSHAALVAQRLRELEVAYATQLGRPCRFAAVPAEFLLALAALEQLRIWETKGLRPHLGQQLPQFDDLITLTWHLLQSDRSASAAEIAVTIWRLIFRLCVDKFAWDASAVSGADMLVGDLDDDAVVDAVAQLLWSLRHTSDG